MEKKLKIRKLYSFTDEVVVEQDQPLETPIKRSVAAAVFKNPYANMYQEDLSLLYGFGEKLGEILSQKAVEGLRLQSGEEAECYGKAVMVGPKGEIEHGHATIHPKIGSPIRSAIGGPDTSRAIIPSTAKIATPGTSIDIPVHYKDSEWVFSHIDTITLTVPDAPYEDEILVAVALTTAGRPLSRIPGMQKQEVELAVKK
ncbi:amino acid synthesis family protein [Siminovitchia acidinfaciens]|uniref:amino acid synthesis family protein n=1 Tax=Siminovitchia acidinfaciens TaxID=2321395 RepID=UPI0013E0D55A|nr:amino acid synthesis family protein [Siminovitchia acidinfaciens]